MEKAMFYKAMERFEYYLFGSRNDKLREKIVVTQVTGDKVVFVNLKDFKAWDEGENFDKIYAGHDQRRFRKFLFERIKSIANNKMSAALVAETMPNPHFTDPKYWEMLKVAVWLDTVSLILKEGLGDEVFFYKLSDAPNEKEWLAYRLGVTATSGGCHEFKGCEYTFKMLRDVSFGMDDDSNDIDADMDWEAFDKDRAAFEKAKKDFVSALWAECRKTLEKRGYNEAIEFLKKYGDNVTFSNDVWREIRRGYGVY